MEPDASTLCSQENKPPPQSSVRQAYLCGIYQTLLGSLRPPNSSIITILFTHNVTKHDRCTFNVMHVTQTSKYFDNHIPECKTLIFKTQVLLQYNYYPILQTRISFTIYCARYCALLTGTTKYFNIAVIYY
jgi:hypothetical protein